MRKRFPDNSFVEILWAGSGTVGTGDEILGVSFSQLDVSASAQPYFESAELESFLAELRSLLDGSQNAAALQSDTGQAKISVETLDSLGHYCVNLRVVKKVNLRGRAFQAEASASFEFEWQDVADLLSACSATVEAGV